MRKNIAQVIAAFQARKPKKHATCSTDGATLFSYSTPLARWEPDGWLWVASEGGLSRTTTMQLRAVRAELGEWIPCQKHDGACRDNRAMAIACVLDQRHRKVHTCPHCKMYPAAFSRWTEDNRCDACSGKEGR